MQEFICVTEEGTYPSNKQIADALSKLCEKNKYFKDDFVVAKGSVATGLHSKHVSWYLRIDWEQREDEECLLS